MKRLFATLAALILLVPACVTLADAAWDASVVKHGDRESRQIAITIDDCYRAEYVREALELSEEYGAPFTFFTLGIVLKEENASLWREVAESPCEIGSHTYTHENLSKMDDEHIYRQLMRAQEALDRTLGYHYPMRVMRPPYGNLSSRTIRFIERLGYGKPILWEIDSIDPDACFKSVQNGSILLFHANPKDIACIEALLPRLLDEGYQPVTISELLGLEDAQTSDEPYVYESYYDWLERQ